MKRRKRSLSQTGGPCALAGDPAVARTLADCLEVDPEAKLPFTHGFHAYPARMHPETARRALEAFPGASVLDPFVGSGTVAVEALRAGRSFTGVDFSPVPLEISWARTRALHPDECRRFERSGLALADRAFAETERPEFRYPPEALSEREWYDPHTLREICVIKSLIDGCEELHRRLFRCVLSSIIVKLSFQASDSDFRMDATHRTRPRGATFRNFADRCSELTKGLLQLSSDLYKRKVQPREPAFVRADARTFRRAADLALSSPPYPGTYDYALQHQRRYWILGGKPEEQLELGARRGFVAETYRNDLGACIGNMMQSAPRAVLLIGDGESIRTDALVAELAAKAGGRVIASASQKRGDWSGGPARREHLILLDRTSSARTSSGR